MFTGLVEEIGVIQEITPLSQGREIQIRAPLICQDLKIDDSVSVDGVCLTVTAVQSDYFNATAVLETLERSTLSRIKKNDRVNLERALQASGRLGGHWVQGHVDAVAKISSIQKLGTGWNIFIEMREPFFKYCVEKGSIAVNGISLTIAAIVKNQIRISVIPHTVARTAIQFIHIGAEVNIEVDILAKYVERMLIMSNTPASHDETWYRMQGF